MTFGWSTSSLNRLYEFSQGANLLSIPTRLQEKMGGGNLAMIMTAEEDMEHTGFTFVPPHNLCNYPQSMGSTQEQAFGTEKFRQNKVLFRKYTTMDGALKKQIVTAMEPLLLFPLVDQLTGFGKVSAITMLQHIFSNYKVIERIDLEENIVKMMGPYDPAEPLARLIKQLEKWK